MTALILALLAASGPVLDVPLIDGWTRSATVANDRSPGRATCTLTGTPPTFGTDGVELNGSSDYILCNDSDAYSFTDGAGNDKPFSACGWIDPDDLTRFVVIAKSNYITPLREWALGFQNTDELFLVVYRADGVKYLGVETSAAQTALAGSFHHICGTYDGSEVIGGFNLYIDGVLQTGNLPISSGGYTGMSPTTTPIRFGVSGAPTHFADGKIAHGKLWRRTLSPTEVEREYAKGRRVVATEVSSLQKGLVFDVPFLSGYTYSNGLVGSNRASPGTSCTATGTPPVFTASDGIDLNGTTDYLICNDVPELSFTWGGGDDKALTFSAWVNPDAGNFLVYYKDDVAANREYQFAVDGSRKLNVAFFDSGGDFLRRRTTNAVVPLDTWSHVAVTYPGDETHTNIKFYVDGAEIVATDNLSSGTYNGMADTTRDMWVGRVSTVYANGTIAIGKMHDRALSAAEMAVLDEQGRRVISIGPSSLQKGLVASWPATSGYQPSATEISDRTPYRQTMDLVASPTMAESGMTLNGTTQYAHHNQVDWRGSDNVGTVLCWATPSTSDGGMVLTTSNLAAGDDFISLRLFPTGSTLQFYINNSGTLSDIRTLDPVHSSGTLIHAGVSVNGSRTLLYVNGVAVSTTVAAGADYGSWFGDVSNRNTVSLGVLSRLAGLTAPFTGEHHGCDVWERELSTAEVETHYEQGRRVNAATIITP